MKLELEFAVFIQISKCMQHLPVSFAIQDKARLDNDLGIPAFEMNKTKMMNITINYNFVLKYLNFKATS